MPIDLTEREREALAEAEVAVFRDRLILDARPPVDEVTLKRVEKRCAGRIPMGLVELWRTAFGGRLDYDLRVRFGEHEHPFSFGELFFPGSHGYHDLWGWIEHEERLAAEASGPLRKLWRRRLDALPFGGFEYLERLYVLTAPGPDTGSVWAWTQGLPGWSFQLQRDSLARVASDVAGLFEALYLEADPWESNPPDDGSGVQMVECLDRLEALGESGRGAAGKLRAMVRTSIVDWRSAIEDGTIAGRPLQRRLALEHAAGDDDVALLERLEAAGCDLRQVVLGGTTALDHALTHGTLRVVRFLLDRGLPVTRALIHGAHGVDLALAAELLERGATVNEAAIVSALDAGNVDVALLMARSTSERFSSLPLAIAARKRALEDEQAARQLEPASVPGASSAKVLRRRAEELNTFADRVDPTLRR